MSKARLRRHHQEYSQTNVNDGQNLWKCRELMRFKVWWSRRRTRWEWLMRPFDRRSKVKTSGTKHRPVEVGTSNVPWKPSVVAFSCVRQTILDMEGRGELAFFSDPMERVFLHFRNREHKFFFRRKICSSMRIFFPCVRCLRSGTGHATSSAWIGDLVHMRECFELLSVVMVCGETLFRVISVYVALPFGCFLRRKIF